MGDPVRWYSIDRQQAQRAKRETRAQLPADWWPAIDAEAVTAVPDWGGATGHPSAQRDVYRAWLDEFGGAQAADLSDAQIKARASAYALEARTMDLGELLDRPWHEFERLLEFCARRNVDPPPVRLLLKGMSSRVRCPYWWRRALRRMVARRCERGALALGLVCATNGQPYASNRSVWRSVDQDRRNLEALQNIVFENDEGYRRTLAELAATSTANKAIRRGELMTRIRGCEEIADECGHLGLFTTHTCPSRFHSTLRDGRRNPRHDGSTPRDAQDWLCGMWEKARAKLARLAVRFYGFRVAEPHHDACTHWHMLVWFECEKDLRVFRRVMRAYWLSEDGDAPGAARHRSRFKRMTRGGAAGYVAKYISKNIDDHGISSHVDDYAEGEIGPDLLGDLEIKPSTRVQAWARTWGIRQFQPFGQPPVTVWRELRRVKESEARAAGIGGTVHKAWVAAQRVGLVLADWARYVKAQGGLMLGRACRIVMRHDAQECEGLYGRQVRKVPVGVALNVACARTVWSERRLWRAIDTPQDEGGCLTAQSAVPRTGVNNCTEPGAEDEAAALRADFLRGAGGATVGVTHASTSIGHRDQGKPPPPGPGGHC